MPKPIEFLIITGLGGLILAALAVASFGGVLFHEGQQVAFASAYPMTERIVTSINILSSNSENSTLNIKLPAVDCTIEFKGNYVQSTVDFKGTKTTYGLFLLPFKVKAPKEIKCNPDSEKKILINKTGNMIEVSE